MRGVHTDRRWLLGVALGVMLLGLGVAVQAGDAVRFAGPPSGGFFVKIPAPGHVVIAVVRVDGGAQSSSGPVPKPQLADPGKLPKGVLAIADVGRVKTQPTVLVSRVLLVNLNKRAARKTSSAGSAKKFLGRDTPPPVEASTGTFNIAVGLKWAPLHYTHPIGIAGEDCAGDAKQIVCSGSDPRQTPLYGWQTTSLDNYIGFFFHPQIGILLSHELGFGPNSAKDQMTAVEHVDVSYFQFGNAVGGKFYLNRPTGQRVSPYLYVDAFKYFATLDTVTSTASTGATTPASSAGTLTSPVGRGKLKVTNVRCYIGTGGNAERDADLSLNGQAGWHFQQVFPASYVPGGSQSKPGFFLEHGQAPYTAPGTTIYAGFGVTVSGNISTITSGQQVTASGGLVDAKGRKVPGSIDLTFACD